jgi:methionyl-tRNA formyltransferase
MSGDGSAGVNPGAGSPRMRLVILTCIRREIASRCLPALCANPALDVRMVILAHGGSPNAKRAIGRKLRKVWKIGPLGAINGVRMRQWYRDEDAEDIEPLCARLGVRFVETEFINCDRTRELFRESAADLGLSLGNGYIAPSVFSIPRFGMLNIHTEILPDFQGAQSIIWPIYHERRETGFTIHQVARAIDAGDILYQERYPIEFRPTLGETVRHMMAFARSRIPQAFAHVCERYEALRRTAAPQAPGTSFTTPSYWQYRRMIRNHDRLYRESLSGSM